MNRVLPTLGLTAAGLALILNFDTRSATSISLSGTATVATTSSTARTSVTTPRTQAPSTATPTFPSGTASAERAQIMSQLPDWVIQRINERFPEGIPLNLLEEVANELNIAFDPSGRTTGSGTARSGSSSSSTTAGPTTTAPSTAGPATTTAPSTAGPATAPSTTGPATTTAPSTTAPSTAKVIDGPAANTPYGPYQVEVTIKGGQITGVRFVRTPRDSQSRAIARYALPRLTSQTLANQSGKVRFISGATYTSAAYQKSLQAALDAVGF